MYTILNGIPGFASLKIETVSRTLGGCFKCLNLKASRHYSKPIVKTLEQSVKYIQS